MDNPNVVYADLDEMVFESRGKDYGAYDLRKKYKQHLFRAAAIAFALFLFGITGPKIAALIGSAEEVIDDGPTEVKINMMDLPPPPSLEDEPPPPPPKIDIPPPKLSSVEYKVPVPKPEEEVLEEETIEEMEKIEESNPGHETVEGDSVGYDFGEIEGEGKVVEEIEVEADPDPNAFIMVEKEPKAINMDEIKALIGYPPQAKEAEIEGKVILRILVGKDGNYEKHIVIKNPHPILTSAVEKHVKNLSFSPAIQANKPVKLWVTIPFVFRLMR